MWCSLQLYANSSPIFLFICSCRVWSSCDCIKTLIPKVNVIQTSLLCFFRYSLVYVDSMASSFSFFCSSSSSILAFYMIIIKDWHINDSVFSNTKPNFSMTCLFFLYLAYCLTFIYTWARIHRKTCWSPTQDSNRTEDSSSLSGGGVIVPPSA